MTPFVQLVTTILSVLVVLGYAIVVLILVCLLSQRAVWARAILRFFGTHAISLSFLVAFGGMVSSLFYSEIAGFAPCLLCWWQRIFLYPQVLLFGLAFKIRDKKIEAYGFVLSVIGAIIAIYHTFLQFGGSPLIPCSTSGISVSCSQRYFLEFGFVTIPTMSLMSFLLIITFALANRSSKKLSL